MSQILTVSEEIKIDTPGNHFFSFFDRAEHQTPKNITILVLHSEAHVKLSGKIFLKEHQKSSWNIEVILYGSSQSADIDIKAVVDDSASLVLTGGATIADSSSLCCAQVHEKVMLFSPHAKARVTPKLCVQTDSVESASHSASIAPFSDELFFFLETKGISKEYAKIILTEGFLQ